MPVVTNTLRTLRYFIADMTAALVSFDRIRWHRSLAEHGAYEPVTSAAAGPAVLGAPRLGPYNVVGLNLVLRLAGTTEVDVTFTGSGELSAATLATQLSLATGLATFSGTTGALVITTVATGTAASVEVIGGEAAPHIGFQVGDTGIGTAADTVLDSDIHEYSIDDANSSDTHWYRVELRNSTSQLTSGLRGPFPANQLPRVPVAQTVVCYLRLSDMSGGPLIGRKVTFAGLGQPNRTGASLDWGVARQYVEAETDANGYLEIRLLRGMLLDFTIDGIGFTRRITIPTTGSDAVNLLDPALVFQDEFGIQEPLIDFADRLTP